MIHIACNIDSNFTIHCAVTLTSLFANNRNSEFCVHIIASTLPEADQTLFLGFIQLQVKTGKHYFTLF